MNKPLAIALLVGGVALAIWGLNAIDSASSEVSEVLTGAPTDKAMWLLIGGGVAALIGLLSLVRSRPAH